MEITRQRFGPTDAEIGAAVRHLIQLLASVRPSAPSHDDLLPIEAAARVACTSPRVVKDAIRSSDLHAYGGQRDRSVRRSDLTAWIESRRVIHPAVDDPDIDADIERRMRRLRARRRAMEKKMRDDRRT